MVPVGEYISKGRRRSSTNSRCPAVSDAMMPPSSHDQPVYSYRQTSNNELFRTVKRIRIFWSHGRIKRSQPANHHLHNSTRRSTPNILRALLPAGPDSTTAIARSIVARWRYSNNEVQVFVHALTGLPRKLSLSEDVTDVHVAPSLAPTKAAPPAVTGLGDASAKTFFVIDCSSCATAAHVFVS